MFMFYLKPKFSFFILICFIYFFLPVFDCYSNDLAQTKKIQLIKLFDWSDNSWTLNQVTSFYYNFPLKEDSIVVSVKRSDTLLNSTLTINKYNQWDSIAETIGAEWYAYNSKWYNTNKTIYTYDSLKKLIREDRYNWKKENVSDNWALGSFYLFYYNSSGQMNLILTFRIIPTTNDTVPHWKIEHFYDKNGNNINTQTSSWDFTAKLWKKPTANWRKYKYDDKKRIIEKIWYLIINDKDTTFQYKESYNYNEFGELIEEIDEKYNDSISLFVNSGRTNYYYSDNLIDSTITYIWKNNVWELQSKKEYIYIVTDVKDNKEIKIVEISISPNPASDYIEITYPSEGFKHSEGFVRIYNLLGDCVMTAGKAEGTHPLIPSKEGKIRLDVSALPAGVYFVRLGEWTGKFVKIE